MTFYQKLILKIKRGVWRTLKKTHDILRMETKKKVINNMTNIFDYNAIITSRPDLDKTTNPTNRLYGVGYILKRYSGYSGAINAKMEHAPGLEVMSFRETEDTDVPYLLVGSEQRVEFVNKNLIQRPILAVGPSIHYAHNLYSDFDLQAIKHNLGKTLCVYPRHNIEDTNFLCDAKEFINSVNEIKEKYGYQTVLVSMYFVDIERGGHLMYEKEGWIVVSAGRRRNYDFNDCMRTIISISDYAVFQGYASAIGYCIYLGVPVTILRPEGRGVVRADSEEAKAWKKTVYNDPRGGVFEEVFKDYDEKISRDKYEFCNYWYGYDSVMEPEEMKCFFEFIEHLKYNDKKTKFIKKAGKKRYAVVRERIMRSVEVIPY